MKNEPKRCPECTLSIGHADDCKYRSIAGLAGDEKTVWLMAFAVTSNAKNANARVRDLRSHIASDEPSLLNGPSKRAAVGDVPDSVVFAGCDSVVVEHGTERFEIRFHEGESPAEIATACNQECGKRGWPQRFVATEEPG